jgi:hypothetical protein
MDDEQTIQEMTKPDQGFISHVFNLDNKSKADMLNTMQYAVLAVLPVILLNRTIHVLIPEADDSKVSLELLAEIISQIGVIFIGIFFIHRIVTYLPTYSESKYDTFSILNSIISFLIIILSLQTKLGEKMNIITDRALMMIQGNVTHVEPKKQELSEYSMPILNHPQQQTTPSHPEQNQFQPQTVIAPENDIMAANETFGGAFGSSF